MSARVEVTGVMARSEDFDPRSFARGALERAKETLQIDGYLIPVAFVVSKTEIHQLHLWFEQEEKLSAYQELIRLAREHEADAIITVNDAFQTDHGSLENYYQGKLRDDGAQECLTVTITGPSIQNWSCSARYKRHNKQISYSETRENTPDDIGMMLDWPMNCKTLN